MTSVFVFISGATLLIFSAEKLIGYLVGAASRLAISVFFLAVIFTGIEFDDVVLGVALNLEELGEVALGLVFGTAISYTGVVLALAAILTPSDVHVPRDYLAIFAVAPLVMAGFALSAPLTVVDGAILLALFVVFIAYIVGREFRTDLPTFRNAEIYEELADAAAEHHPNRGIEPGEGSSPVPFDEERKLPGWANLGLAVVALVGLLIGASTTSMGTKEVLEAYGIERTIFGATIVTLALTIEDLFLTVEPFRRGVPAIGIGNVIGSLVFTVTAKLAVVILSGGTIVVGPDVIRWHLPMLVLLTGVAAYFLFTGRLKRWHGYTLLGLYIVYWAVSFAVFGGAPVES
jgi:cation:H+ antiporter